MTDTTQTLVLALAAVLLVAPVAAAAPSPGGPLVAQATETPTATTAGNASVTPGEKLSGVVSVQQAELEGEVAERTYGVKIARANSSGAKAAVVAETVGDVQQRVDQLEQRKRTLEEARRNGSMSDGEYRAKMAKVAVELSTAERLANATAETAEGLPEDVLAEKGINVSAIRTLKDRAQNLSGPQVATIAQSIAGRDVGKSMAGAQKPSDVGKQMGNGTGGPPTDQGGAPNGTDGGPPNGTDGGPPNGTDGTENGSDNRP